MSSGLLTLGWEGPIGSPVVGGGASGVTIPFEVRNDDGLQAGVNVSGASVIRVSVNGGVTWTNRAGAAPTEGEDGIYRYTADATEVAAAITTGYLLVKFKLATYNTVTERADVNDSQLAAALLTITNAITSETTSIGGEIAGAVSQINAHTDLDTNPLALQATLVDVQTDVDDVQIDVDEVQGTLSGAIASRFDAVDAATAAIKAKTDPLPSDPADASVIAARFDTIDASIAGTAAAVLAEFQTWNHDGGRTWKGLQIRIEAILTGVARHMNGPHAQWLRSDGSTIAIESDTDDATGTRGAPDVTGSEP